MLLAVGAVLGLPDGQPHVGDRSPRVRACRHEHVGDPPLQRLGRRQGAPPAHSPAPGTRKDLTIPESRRKRVRD